MFSTRRRCTSSASAIKMVPGMAFPATCDYLSRFGALKPMAINVLLRGVRSVVLSARRRRRRETDKTGRPHGTFRLAQTRPAQIAGQEISFRESEDCAG